MKNTLIVILFLALLGGYQVSKAYVKLTQEQAFVTGCQTALFANMSPQVAEELDDLVNKFCKLLYVDSLRRGQEDKQ